MSLHSISAGKMRSRELALLALMAAFMAVSQVALAVIPNVHLVGILVIVNTMIFGWKALYSVIVFAFLEMIIYGAGIWVINYFYIWPLLVACVMPFRKVSSPLFWGIFASIHGLTFGVQCSVPYFLTGGWAAGFSYWVAGIPFDLIHGASNFVLGILLVKPLYILCSRLLKLEVVPSG